MDKRKTIICNVSKKKKKSDLQTDYYEEADPTVAETPEAETALDSSPPVSVGHHAGTTAGIAMTVLFLVGLVIGGMIVAWRRHRRRFDYSIIRRQMGNWMRSHPARDSRVGLRPRAPAQEMSDLRGSSSPEHQLPEEPTRQTDGASSIAAEGCDLEEKSKANIF